MTEEMVKLRKMLDEKNIVYLDKSDPLDWPIRIDRTHFFYNKNFYSVVHGYGTYGGISIYGKDHKLLEVQIGNHEPVGFKTADDVMKMLEGNND